MPFPRPMFPIVAAVELALIAPAALFMASLFIRELQPLQYEPARTAQQVVLWYSARPWTLGILLIALPLVGLGAGVALLVGRWRASAELREAVRQTASAIRVHLATLLVAVASLTAAGILAIVFVHAITD